MTIFQRGPPPKWASYADDVGTYRDSLQISGYRSMTGGVQTTTATIHRAVYRRDHRTSLNLCLSQSAWTITTKRTEQHLFARSGKSVAEVPGK